MSDISKQDPDSGICQLLRHLDTAEVAYMLVGSYSTNHYSMPRATNDVDLVVKATARQFDQLFDQLGDDFELDPQQKIETITMTKRWEMTYLPVSFRVELFELSEDPFDQTRFERRVLQDVEALQRPAWVPTVEDVLIQKLRWGRMKDLADAVNLAAFHKDSMDWRYVRDWVKEHGSGERLEQVEAEI